MKELREYMYDKDFRNRLDSDPNLIAFKNGVWELREKQFRRATPEDYVCLNVGYDYTPDDTEEDKVKIKQYWRTLHPEEEQRTYMKKTFSRQLYGDNGNNLFHFHAGKGGTAANGKTLFFEILQLSVGEDGVGYSCKFDVSVLLSDRKDKQGKAVPELAEWRGVRFLYCSEPNPDETINSGVMKTITGGESIKFRELYKSQIQTFRPMHKIHLMCNDAPRVDGRDIGVRRRIVMAEYNSRFVPAEDADPTEHKYPIDAGLGQSFRESMGLRMAFLRELLHEYDHGFDFKLPASVRDSSRMYIEENDPVFGFVKECIVYEKGAYFTLTQAKVSFTSSEHYKNNFRISKLKTDLERALGVMSLDQKWVNNSNEKNVFWDHKLSSNQSFVTYHNIVDDPLEPSV
jgi:P4 family phage/plasmid primase-like protien